MIRKKIEELASNILQKWNMDVAPIPIDKIAELEGLKIHTYDLGENISGALVINNNEGIIGVNSSEPPFRKRFTIAHELGHFLLHNTKKESLFVDKEFKVLFRNQQSSTGEDKREHEANAFAAAILMPREILVNSISELSLDLTDEDAISRLADKFKVSSVSMTYRISNLNLI